MAMHALVQLNALSATAAREELLRCCGSQEFAAKLAAARPFASPEAVHEAALRVWWNEVGVAGWLEAFAAHPRIGDVESLRKKFAATAEWCEGEQGAALRSASETVLQELSAWNARYEAKFGHTFVACATGRPANELLALLRQRYPSTPHAELARAAAEQAQITALRLDKLVAALAPSAERRTGAIEAHVVAPASVAPRTRPPVTTHVLDMSRGGPAACVPATLEVQERGGWSVLGSGATDVDGRCASLLSATHALRAGTYRITFDVASYHASCGGEPGAAFYPSCAVTFCVTPAQVAQHFHIPLLLAPFGYSTYRGS